MANDLSKTEYLKRYLKNDEKKSKRKKKATQPTTNSHMSRIKILDRNIDLKSIKFGEKEDDDEDEAPVVAEVIDERPAEVKLKEIYESSRWKKLDSVAGESNNFSKDSDLLPDEHLTSKQDNRLGSLSDNQICQKSRHDSDIDDSPRRPKENNIRIRHDSDNDSLPRKYSSPIHKKRRHDSDSDNSPPRRQSRDSEKHKRNSSHRSAGTSDKFKHGDSDSDLSPERIRPLVTKGNKNRQEINNSDSDLSPPREMNYDSSQKKEDKKRPVKTLSGLKAGLQNAATLRKETSELRIREKNLIEKLDAELSGRHADTVVRDRKTGRKRDLEEENQEKEKKEKRISEQQKKYDEWGKGIEQTENQKSRLSEDVYEMTKPLARYCDDEDLEDRLKSIIYDDDPMSEYMKKKKRKNLPNTLPEYNGPPPPPNRFSIKPGYRWDGVDRSNGFEKKYFQQHSNKKATQEEAYLWSVQNM